ncbi:CD226 antigen isoform X2 [Esox lucius]|uniref:Ig-like domain-containing protein n=1 Tax=Esox lucius TaxID=8010 RepID=A0A3P8X844_ESOLU|nr:CD226 antigen isoform X2 [Esox lucius]
MMETVQKDHWYFMVLLVFLLILKVSIQQSGSVATVKLGEGMVLGCVCPWDGNLSMVSWTKLIRFEKAPVAVYHPEYGVYISPPYQTRIRFLKTTPMDGSVTLRNVSQEDAGLYHCSVQTFPQGSWAIDIRVELDPGTVEEETVEETNIHLNETHPEVIKADTELTAERSENLTISCIHQHNGSVYRVTLEKLDRGGTGGGVLMALCQLKDGGLFEVNYTDRGVVNCSRRLDADLQLDGVTEQDGGLYRCRFSTDAGDLTTTVRLTVPRQVTLSLSVNLLYITGAAGVLLLLSSISLVLVLWKRKKRIEKYGSKLHPAQRRLCNAYENVPVYDRMWKGTNPGREMPVYANIRTAHPPAKRKR